MNGIKAIQRLWGGIVQGSKVVVDSAPLIYILDNHPLFSLQFEGLFDAQERGDISIALSTITLTEVLAGPYKAGAITLAKRYEQALLNFDMVPVTPTIAVLAAQLRAQYRLKAPDAIQLATALEIGASALVTHDRDFSSVTGIRVILGDQPV